MGIGVVELAVMALCGGLMGLGALAVVVLLATRRRQPERKDG